MPDWKDEIKERLARLRLEPAREAEIVEELSQHLEDRYAELLGSGATPEEASRAALAELSSGEILQQELGRVERPAPQEPIVLGANRRTNMLADLWQDLRYGARMLMKSPGFTLVIVLTLALGIGANTTMFSLLDAVLFRPLPGIAEAERVVQIGRAISRGGLGSISCPDYRDYRDQNSTFAGVAAESAEQFHLGSDKIAIRVKGAMVSGNYFDVLGVRAAQGRLLQPYEAEIEGANPVAVISERVWRKEFGAEPVIGKTISLNSYRYTVIGVAAEFNGTVRLKERTDVWIPMTMWRQGNPLMAQSGVDWLNSRGSNLWLFGRLKPGVTIERAQADLSTIAKRLGRTYPETNAKQGVRVVAEFGMSPRERMEIGLLIGVLFGVVVIVLLIACANVAGLTLARACARRKEMGIRLALGAGRFRLARQLLTESAALALLGGALSIAVALWLIYWIRAALPDEIRDAGAQIGFTPDWRVLGLTVGLSGVTGLLFGLAPALQFSKPDLIPALTDSGGSFSYRGGGRLRGVLVVVQIALSLVLLISAGLCVRTLQNATAIDVGFATENVLTAKFDLERQNYSEAQGREFYRRLLERLAVLPGAQAASLSLNTPLSRRGSGVFIAVDNRPPVDVVYNVVTPGHLDTMGIPLLLGRQFTERDDAGSPRVAVINETFARQVWPNENPVGKFFKLRPRADNQSVEVIGVGRDARGQSLIDDPPRVAYFPLAQRYSGEMTLHLRSATKPELLTAALRQEIRALDPTLPVYNVKTLEQYQRDYLFTQRFQAALIGGFGLLALALASLGLYGALSYGVAQRTQEIGVRMALGARTGDVLRLVVGKGIRLIAAGVALGLAGALAAARVLKSLLFGVSATDPLTYAAVAALLTCVALLACYIPARRATKVDPLIALRFE
jgi:macrolide transport system ATP-binding/permease protein